MQVRAVHHINFRVSAAEVQRLSQFYCDIVGLRVGPRPPFRSAGLWLYAGDAAIVHLVEAEGSSLPPVEERRSAIDHVAFACEGLPDAVARLAAHGIAYTVAEVPMTGEAQLFFRDPAGVGVELNFAAQESR